MNTVVLPKNDFLLGLEYFFKKYGYNEVYGSWCFNGDRWLFCDFAVCEPENEAAREEINTYLNTQMECHLLGDDYFSEFFYDKEVPEDVMLVYKDGNFYMREDLILEKLELNYDDNEFLIELSELFKEYEYTKAYGEIYFIQGMVYIDCIKLPYHFNEQAMTDFMRVLQKYRKSPQGFPMCLIGDYVIEKDEELLYEDGKFWVHRRRGELAGIFE